MPKPTTGELAEAFQGVSAIADRERVRALIDAAWEKSERLEPYIQHKPECAWWLTVQEGGGGCSCGLYALLDGSRGERAPAQCATAVADDVEQYNREQRIRREAYAEGLAPRHLDPLGRKRLAAKRYPLRKHVPKVIEDPHCRGSWRLVAEDADHKERAQFSNDGVLDWHDPSTLLWTSDRIRALAALLKNPWTFEESTEVESGQPQNGRCASGTRT
jgi:hypothetical protein